MEKRQRSVSLSFVLFRFAIVMLGSMLLCCLAWYVVMVRLQQEGIIYQGAISNQQVERMLAGEPETFVSPDEDFLAEYALYHPDGEILESNVEGKKLDALTDFFEKDTNDIHVAKYTYPDGNTIICRWVYRAEFVNPKLRDMLPPAEYVGLALLATALMLCLLFNTLRLRRRLAAKLQLFSEVSEKVGAQELDFVVPHAGILEYDQALAAMEHMRQALYQSLTSQWAVQQEREAEIAALAHDLKTPLTLAGGNAELLLEEELPVRSRRMVETIAESCGRAGQYVASLLETASGGNEIWEDASLPALFDELCKSTKAVAEAKGVYIHAHNALEGAAGIQRERLLRALGNVVLNAVEYTAPGGSVYLEGSMTDGGWQVTVRDEGPGFSRAALKHGTERLWREDAARTADGHNGLGLWLAAEVVKEHGGELKIQNYDSGGEVILSGRII